MLPTYILVVAIGIVIPVCAFGQESSYEFYIGALKNYKGEASHILLYIMTLSSSPVTYTVETNHETIATGNVTNTTVAKLNITSVLNLVVIDSSYQYRYNGVYISANDKVFVLLINFFLRSIGEYFAYPIVQNLTLSQYQYYAVSTSTVSSALSEVLLVGTENNTTVTVVPTQNITVPQNIQLSNSMEIDITAGTPFSFTLHELQTFIFGASGNDITGTSIVSDKPLTVISGHECGNVPDNIPYCEHLTEQIPPTVNWGQQFLLTPYSGRPVQYYKIISAENETTYNLTCGRGNIVHYYLQASGKYNTHSTCSNCYCFISSDKPILVIQLGPGYELGDTGDPVISLVPSVNQYSYEAVFILLDLERITTHYINIATTANDSTILLDGDELSLTWNVIYDHTNNVIGHGTQLNTTELSLDIPHTLTSYDNFSTLVYGFGRNSGYSYSTGVNIQGIKSC